MTAAILPIGPKYYGSKTIYATEKTLGEYKAIRNWTVSENENPDQPGYMVQYEDGYISWSPKEVFESAYRKTDALTFGQAIEALKQGKKVARKGWNGKGMYPWLLPAASVQRSWVKDPMLLSVFGDREELVCLGSIRMLTATGEVLASQTDMLAEDWVILD